ncbi:hypothetical protein COL28_20470 [Bacillus thuringiensis]|uniref:BppU family phage baseplate upper protein n=1 Tax=Bacillus thuringiensis TaxID=1428 RepID=UPI000BF44152|nr:BppU family phage baseplate upper protein [Bacillus thuringiensis]PFW41308.1 hypothetical protein COL28_20470 [Bacillus thuringiensis]
MKTKLILDIRKTQYAQLNSIVMGRVGDKASNTVDVYVVDGFTPYNLTGSDVYFECTKPDNTAVRDKDGITIIDASRGHFEYTFPAQTFAAIGKSKQAYFSIEKNSTVRATTQDFIIVSTPDALTNRIPSQTYISQLDQLIRDLEAMQLDILNSEAYKEAHDAKEFSEQAKSISESVQNQLNQIVINSSIDPETKQARVDLGGYVFNTLKERIDADQKKIGTLSVLGSKPSDLAKIISRRGIDVYDFGAKGDGVADDTAAIQAAIDFVYNLGGGVVTISKGVFKYTSFTLRQGVFLNGLNMPTDGNMRSNKKAMPTVLYPTSIILPSIIMYGGAGIKGVCWDYRDQVRFLENETDDFIQYPATIQLGTDTEPAIGCYIGNFLLFGAYTFLEQKSFAKSAEKLTVENGFGAALDCFARIKKSSDISRFENIHMNLNTVMANWLTGDVTNYYNKVAKNATMFRFSRVDDCLITNCFAYGMKHLIHFYKDSDPADDGGGGGATLSGTSIDVCHQVFKIERKNFGMGIKVTGGFFTPVVSIPDSEQALVWYGNDAQFTRVNLTNIRMYGTTVPQVSGSKSTGYVVVYDSTSGKNNPITITGEVDQYSTALVKNEDKTNYNTLQLIGRDKGIPVLNSYRATFDILTLLNSRVYLNHPANDKVAFRINGSTSANDAFYAQFDETGALLAASKYLQAGNVTSLPTPSIQYRGREIRVEGGTGVADKICVCVKKADNTYGWFDTTAGTFVGDPDWTTLSTSFGTVGGRPLRYKKTSGIVSITGSVSSATSNTTFATLPAGFRPIQDTVFVVQDAVGNKGVELTIKADGGMVLQGLASNATVHMSATFII